MMLSNTVYKFEIMNATKHLFLPPARIFSSLRIGILLGVTLAGSLAYSQNRGAVAVRTQVTEISSLTENLTLNGVIRSDESARIRAEVAGLIVELPFQEAGEVEEGQLLVRLDGSEIAAEISEITAEIELAKRNLTRLQRLADNNAISEEALDQAATRLKTLEARKNRLEARYRKTHIRAPFAGRTGLRQVSIGDYLSEGDFITDVEKVDVLKVDFGIPEIYQNRLKKGLPIQVTAAGVSAVIEGELTAWNNRVNENTRTIQLRGEIPNENDTFLPGNFVTVEITLDQIEETILIPTTALVRSLGKASVYVVKDNVAHEREVQVGIRQSARIQILDGLEEGEVIVTHGTQALSDGSQVRNIQI